MTYNIDSKADVADRILDQVREITHQLLDENTYTFVEEFCDSLADVVNNADLYFRCPNISTAYDDDSFIIEFNAVCDDDEVLTVKINNSDLDDEITGRILDHFEGIVVPFDIHEIYWPEKFADDSEVLVDMMTKTKTLYLALKSTAVWLQSDHVVGDMAADLLRRAYHANRDDDPFGKIIAIVLNNATRYNVEVSLSRFRPAPFFNGPGFPVSSEIMSHDNISREPYEMFNDPDYHLDVLDVVGIRVVGNVVGQYTEHWKVHLDLLDATMMSVFDPGDYAPMPNANGEMEPYTKERYGRDVAEAKKLICSRPKLKKLVEAILGQKLGDDDA